MRNNEYYLLPQRDYGLQPRVVPQSGKLPWVNAGKIINPNGDLYKSSSERRQLRRSGIFVEPDRTRISSPVGATPRRGPADCRPANVAPTGLEMPYCSCCYKYFTPTGLISILPSPWLPPALQSGGWST